MNNIPSDTDLYQKVSDDIKNRYPVHSAYRSGMIVKEYKKQFKLKYGNRKRPYKGKKNPDKGLTRWFREEWKTQSGNIGYKYKSDIYRPTHRITKQTPTTLSELTEKQVKRARREKARTGRVKAFEL
jgi:hypothetical protein